MRNCLEKKWKNIRVFPKIIPTEISPLSSPWGSPGSLSSFKDVRKNSLEIAPRSPSLGGSPEDSCQISSWRIFLQILFQLFFPKDSQKSNIVRWTNFNYFGVNRVDHPNDPIIRIQFLCQIDKSQIIGKSTVGSWCTEPQWIRLKSTEQTIQDWVCTSDRFNFIFLKNFQKLRKWKYIITS